RRQHRHHHEEGGEQDQPERDPVDAQVEADAERLDPGPVHLELEPRLGGLELGEDEQRDEKRHQGYEQAEAAVDGLLLARDQHDQAGAEERQEGDPAQEPHHFTSTFFSASSLLPQRGSLTVTLTVYVPGRSYTWCPSAEGLASPGEPSP